jgi:predicted transcriptional regulator
MRRLIAGVAVIALMGAIGCGEETTVSDDAIVQALNLKRADDAPVYEVGGDPFCQVEQELLNDSNEVEEAENDKNALVVADSTATIGIQVIPPFDTACEQDVRKALNKLAQEEEG